ncbi:MAG: FAD-dependent thymidylate synthase, partial [Alphaproteobacteria bacterium]
MSAKPEHPPAAPEAESGDDRIGADERAQIEAQRAAQTQTRRPSVPDLEEILYEPLPVLDRGFVRVVDYMGDDDAIVQAARVSYGKGTKQLREDRGLIRYLMRHRHTTPFEMCEIKYHIMLPVFVARQWIRHRTANVNEYSARYSILEDEFYLPAPDQLATQSRVSRQGRGQVLAGEEAARVLEILHDDAARTYGHYQEMLNERADGSVIDPARQGLARELARMNLTLN